MKKPLIVFIILYFLVLITTVFIDNIIPEKVYPYSGAGAIWAQRKGEFTAKAFTGDSIGLEAARAYCVNKGGGVIQMGPGTENIGIRPGLEPNILLLKSFMTGWSSTPTSIIDVAVLDTLNFRSVRGDTVRTNYLTGKLSNSASTTHLGNVVINDSLRVNNTLEVVGNLKGKLVVADSFRVGLGAKIPGTLLLDPPGKIINSGTTNLFDSLNVSGPIVVTRKGSTPSIIKLGTGGTVQSDSSVIQINVPDPGGSIGGRIFFLSNSVPQASIDISTSGMEINIDSSSVADAVRFRKLGKSGVAGVFGMIAATGKMTIGAGTLPGANLDVQGNAIVKDSLRVSEGLYVGGQITTKILHANATLNFDLSAVNCQDLTVTVSGAADGDPVFIGVPNGTIVADEVFTAWVSSANTVTIRACDYAGAGNPASGTYRVTVFKQ